MITVPEINAICPGWSGDAHYAYFAQKVDALTANANVLMLGVYMGRDLAYIGTVAKAIGKPLNLIGVDLFSDAPCADWSPDARGMTWQQAHGVAPPNIVLTRMNLDRCGVDECELIEMAAQDYLRQTPKQYDFVYVDVAHDYQTTWDVLALAIPKLKPGGILAGDDFSNEGTWGVEKAVRERFPTGVVEHPGRIWEVTV